MAEKWKIQGTWIEACNCDYGCACNYSGFPSKGNCEGTVAFKVDKGTHGKTKLDGIAVVGLASWPGAIHEGNGRMAVIIDEKATPEQREAIVSILTGQDGGMPFEILATTISDIIGPIFAPVTFEENGTDTKVSTAGVEVQLETFKNPVTGERNEVHTVLPEGFIWKDGQVCKSARNIAKVDGLEYDWTGQNGYFAKVSWSN